MIAWGNCQVAFTELRFFLLSLQLTEIYGRSYVSLKQLLVPKIQGRSPEMNVLMRPTDIVCTG